MIKKEEAEKVVDKLKLQLLSMAGSSVELVGVENNNIKLKLSCPKMEFKVKGKIVTMEEEVKKKIEEHIKANIKNANVIFC